MSARDDLIEALVRTTVLSGADLGPLVRAAQAEVRADLRARVEALRSGEGWYGFIKRPEATTHIAYVHESGEVWIPDMGWTTAGEFALLAEGKEERLIGVDDVLSLLEEKP